MYHVGRSRKKDPRQKPRLDGSSCRDCIAALEANCRGFPLDAGLDVVVGVQYML